MVAMPAPSMTLPVIHQLITKVVADARNRQLKVLMMLFRLESMNLPEMS